MTFPLATMSPRAGEGPGPTNRRGVSAKETGAVKRGGGCRRRCQQAGAHPQGLPLGTGEALSLPSGPTSDGPVPGLALGGSAQAWSRSGGRVG